MVLRPNPAFLPKVLTDFHLSQSVELRSLSSSNAGEEVEDTTLCPVRAVTAYIQRTQAVRRSDQLFVCYDPGRVGRPLSKSRLSHWVVDTIRQAYVLSGMPVPSGVRAHSSGCGRFMGLVAGGLPRFHMLCRHMVVSVNIH